MPYGLFVNLPQCGAKIRGLLHNSELTIREGDERPKNLKEGDFIEVEIIRIDDKGRLGLSRRSTLIRREREEVADYQKKLESESKMGTMADLFRSIKLKGK